MHHLEKILLAPELLWWWGYNALILGEKTQNRTNLEGPWHEGYKSSSQVQSSYLWVRFILVGSERGLVCFALCREKIKGGHKYVPAIGEISAHDQRDLLFAQLFDGDLERVRFAFQVDEDGRVHTIWTKSISRMFSLRGSPFDHAYGFLSSCCFRLSHSFPPLLTTYYSHFSNSSIHSRWIERNNQLT